MTRYEVYERILNRLSGMKGFAQKNGDGVQADKIRKIQVDVLRLRNDEDNPELKEISSGINR